MGIIFQLLRRKKSTSFSVCQNEENLSLHLRFYIFVNALAPQSFKLLESLARKRNFSRQRFKTFSNKSNAIRFQLKSPLRIQVPIVFLKFQIFLKNHTVQIKVTCQSGERFQSFIFRPFHRFKHKLQPRVLFFSRSSCLAHCKS